MTSLKDSDDTQPQSHWLCERRMFTAFTVFTVAHSECDVSWLLSLLTLVVNTHYNLLSESSKPSFNMQLFFLLISVLPLHCTGTAYLPWLFFIHYLHLIEWNNYTDCLNCVFLRHGPLVSRGVFYYTITEQGGRECLCKSVLVKRLWEETSCSLASSGSHHVSLVRLWGRSLGSSSVAWVQCSDVEAFMVQRWPLTWRHNGYCVWLPAGNSGPTLTSTHGEQWETGGAPDSWHLFLFLSERALYFLSVQAADFSVFLHSLSHQLLWDLIESCWWLCSSLWPSQYWYSSPLVDFPSQL